MHPAASAPLLVTFTAIALAVAAGIIVVLRRSGAWAPRAAVIYAAWLLVPLGLAAAGILADWSVRPPPFAAVIVIVTIGTVVATLRLRDRIVAAIPLWVLVLTQGFRLPLELVMHEAAAEGVMPGQMTWTGLNFDILTGVTAILLGAWLRIGRVPRWVVMLWTVAGFGLLVNVVTIAVLSLPPIARFGPDALNTWVADAPFIWLPTLLVQAALAGHLLVWRAIRR